MLPSPLLLPLLPLLLLADVLFTDLPAPSPDNEAAWQASQPDLPQSLRAQLLTLKRQFGLASGEEEAELERHRAATNDRLRPTRDAGVCLSGVGWRQGASEVSFSFSCIMQQVSRSTAHHSLYLPPSSALRLRRPLQTASASKSCC